MVRRAANQVQAAPGQPTTILSVGWVLGWYAQPDGTYIAYFEENQHGFVSKIPLETVQFQDGLPAQIPVIV